MLSALVSWLLGWSRSVLTWLYNYAIDFLQKLFDSLIDAVSGLISLFPDCLEACREFIVPAPPSGVMMNFIISLLNWLFPMSFFVTCMNVMTCALLFAVTIMPILRWCKLV